jgi:hypothetical protein
VLRWLERVRSEPRHAPITAELGTLARWP